VVFACHVRLFAMPQAIRFGAGLGYCTNTIKMVHDPLSKAAPPLICLYEVLWMEAWVGHVLWQSIFRKYLCFKSPKRPILVFGQ